MTGVVACVPTVGLSDDLDDLLEVLVKTSVPTRLYVNSAGIPERVLRVVEGWPHGGLLDLVHRPDLSIYAEWNEAAAWAAEEGAHLLVLNDDIVVPSALAQRLHDTLEGHPTYGLVGVAGPDVEDAPPYALRECSFLLGNRYHFSAWCFAVRCGAWQDIDPGYRVWFGDDDLLQKTLTTGWQVGVLQGVGVLHHTSTTSNQLEWTQAAAGEDGQRWAASH